MREKNYAFNQQALKKKKITHVLLPWKPLKDVLQQNKGVKQQRVILEIQKMEIQPEK